MSDAAKPSPFQLPESMLAPLRDSGGTLEAAKAAIAAMKAMGLDVREIEKTYETLTASRKIMLDAFDKKAGK
jgi:hypothetical protein